MRLVVSNLLFLLPILESSDVSIYNTISLLYDSTVISGETCSDELSQYDAIPVITSDPGKDYDVGSLTIFQDIGESFLALVTRNSLYDTVKLVKDLSPIDSTGKVLALIEFQLILFIVLFIGITTAVMTLTAIIIYWAMKLTGKVKEVEYQKLSDSKGPKRFLLSFLACVFSILILFGCLISWVGNAHIAHNIDEVADHVKWTVNTTSDYMDQVELQMRRLLVDQYEQTYLNVLEQGINDAIHDASARVYLYIAENITQSSNISVSLANSITNVQRPAMNTLEGKYLEYENNLFTYIREIKAAKECVATIDTWCNERPGTCNSDKSIPESYLNSLEPEKMFFENVAQASLDATNFVENSDITLNIMLAYYNGIYFHNGSLANTSSLTTPFVGTCSKTDPITGDVLVINGDSAQIEEIVKCYSVLGCLISNTMTRLLTHVCCIDVDVIKTYLDSVDEDEPPDLDQCGPKELSDEHGVIQEGGSQSHYTGTMSKTITNKPCVSWGEVVKVAAATQLDVDVYWDTWAAANGYSGLSAVGPDSVTNKFCRNPSPAVGIYGTETEAGVKHRAWCFTDADTMNWEYCNVPFCPSDASSTLTAIESDPSSLIYPTCQSVTERMYPDGVTPLTSHDFTMWIASENERQLRDETLEESSREAIAQFDKISSDFDEAQYDIQELQDSIMSQLVNSNGGKIRDVAIATVTGVCLLTVCITLTGLCVGYCNMGENVPPHRRSAGCSAGGKLIKTSSHIAALLAVLSLLSATSYFIPGSVLSLVCTDYNNDDLFKLLDDKVLVNYSVLGRAVLGDDNYDSMTLKKFLLDCRKDLTLWEALSLSNDPNYDLKNLLDIEETVDIEGTFSRLLEGESVDFTSYPVFPDSLRTWLHFWNDSDTTNLEWDALLDNVRTPFLGLSKNQLDEDSDEVVLINGKYLCDAFKPFGAQVSDRSGAAYECSAKFKSSQKSECMKWVEDYDNSVTSINILKESVEDVVNEWEGYDVGALIDKYEKTNTNLLNLEGSDSFSLKIISEAYRSDWQPELIKQTDCLNWYFNHTMDKEIATCYPVSNVIDTTLRYLCDYALTSVKLCWISQGLLGLVLTLFVLVTRNLANYFLKYEKRHPMDITKEEQIAAFQRA